jgi:hypothetical protein
VPQRPLILQGALTQVEDISGKAECALEIPIMAVTSSSTATPAPTAGHDKQPTTVTLLLSSSSSKHVPTASDASFQPPTIELGVAPAVNAGAGHRSDAHADTVETVEEAEQDDALLVLHALESQGKGPEQENEWSSEEQRLVTFSAWPFSDNPRYPQVNSLRVAPMLTGCIHSLLHPVSIQHSIQHSIQLSTLIHRPLLSRQRALSLRRRLRHKIRCLCSGFWDQFSDSGLGLGFNVLTPTPCHMMR